MNVFSFHISSKWTLLTTTGFVKNQHRKSFVLRKKCLSRKVLWYNFELDSVIKINFSSIMTNVLFSDIANELRHWNHEWNSLILQPLCTFFKFLKKSKYLVRYLVAWVISLCLLCYQSDFWELEFGSSWFFIIS